MVVIVLIWPWGAGSYRQRGGGGGEKWLWSVFSCKASRLLGWWVLELSVLERKEHKPASNVGQVV